jgi:hypothetical protein
MSKLFSIISLETNTGIQDIGIMDGIPEVEDIQNLQTYKELLEDCGGSKYISMVVQPFCYGEGAPESVSNQDLTWIRSHSEILENGEAVRLPPTHLTIIHPDQGMQMNM